MESETLSEILDKCSKHLECPNYATKIYKDECTLSMRTPFNEGGIFLNLKTLESFSEEFLNYDFERTKNKLYLKIKKTKLKKKEEIVEKENKVAENLLSISKSDDLASVEISSFYEVFIFPESISVSIDNPIINNHLKNIIKEVIGNEGNNTCRKLQNWLEEVKISKYSENLPHAFEDSNEMKLKKFMNLNDLRCENCGADSNLWLNLSDGYVGCGRKIYSVGGGCKNGDEGAALSHFHKTGDKYPLVVKLGTITPFSADVFSYAADENDKVIDSKLDEHLARFGIVAENLEKTEKTTAELEVSRNLQFDWSSVMEENEKLTKLIGPSFIGLENLGNSCYMNSVLQLILSLQETKQKFVHFFDDIIQSLPISSRASQDFCVQFAKLAVAVATAPLYLTEGVDTSKEEVYVSPRMLCQIVAKDHAEFSSNRQQDAEEYLSHFLDVFQTNEKNLNLRLKKKDIPNKLIASLFKFSIEHCLTCCQSKQVRYSETKTHAISLDIHEEKNAMNWSDIVKNNSEDNYFKKQRVSEGKNDEKEEKNTDNFKKDECGEPVRPKIKLSTLLDAWAAEELRKDYLSPVTKMTGYAINRNRIKTFPYYLILHVKRFYAKEDWTAAKKDCYILVDDVIDLEKYRGFGLAPNEEEMNDDDENERKEKKFEINETLVAIIEELGFPHNLAVNACIATRNGPQEECVDWCLQNYKNEKMKNEIMSFEGEGSTNEDLLREEKQVIEKMSLMGFPEKMCRYAYKIVKETNEGVEQKSKCDDKFISSYVEECVQLLLNYSPEDLEIKYKECEERRKHEGENHKDEISISPDGPGIYDLYGFISHLGKSANCGHYACHLKHPTSGWVLYNDRKVALSKNPPKQFGYIYIYKRKTI